MTSTVKYFLAWFVAWYSRTYFKAFSITFWVDAFWFTIIMAICTNISTFLQTLADTTLILTFHIASSTRLPTPSATFMSTNKYFLAFSFTRLMEILHTRSTSTTTFITTWECYLTRFSADQLLVQLRVQARYVYSMPTSIQHFNHIFKAFLLRTISSTRKFALMPTR